MRYIVTLDASSVIGTNYVKTGSHDGTNGGHPTLDCESVDTSHHYCEGVFIRNRSGSGGRVGRSRSGR